MFRTVLVLLFALLFAAPSHASVITTGAWQAGPQASNNGSTFYSNTSWDGAELNIGFLLEGTANLEYLTPASFSIEGELLGLTFVGGITAWANGQLTFTDGVFHYNSGTGHLSDSLSMPWQYALFRQVNGNLTIYWLGIEDITFGNNDWDYNDYVVRFEQQRQGEAPVPEPTVLSLLLLGGAYVFRQKAHSLRHGEGSSRQA